jgi:hypothetical protein
VKPTSLYRLNMNSPLSGDAVAMIVVTVVLFVIAWFQMTVPLKAIKIKIDNLDKKVDGLEKKVDSLDRTTLKKFW